jgi:Holliday junction DNA helicase RuvA
VVAEKSACDAVIEVQGVGYRVNLSLLALSKLPEVGATAALRIRTVVREDAFDLFGFLSLAEENLFLLLTSVSRVGPKTAIGLMGGLEVEDLIAAIARGDVVRLSKIRGCGRKTAERFVLELKEKARVLSLEGQPSPSGTRKPAPGSDLISALINLGYKDLQAENAAQVATERVGGEAGFELQFREALKVLRG